MYFLIFYISRKKELKCISDTYRTSFKVNINLKIKLNLRLKQFYIIN